MEGTRKSAMSTLLLKQVRSLPFFLTTAKTVTFAYCFLTAFVLLTLFFVLSVFTKPSGGDLNGSILLTEEMMQGSADVHSVSANQCISTPYRSYQQPPSGGLLLPSRPPETQTRETHRDLDATEERNNSAVGKWEDWRESSNGTGNFSVLINNSLERKADPDTQSKTQGVQLVTPAGDGGAISDNTTNMVITENAGNASAGLGEGGGDRRRRSRRRPIKSSRTTGGGGEKRNAECNIFEGRWVRDDSYPLYAAGSCPLVHETVDCFKNGRQDRLYEKWRWQPKDCNIPRLDGKGMLERLRGKRLAFVGDSLNRNMWASLLCILWSSVEDKRTVRWAIGRRQFGTPRGGGFTFTDYNCSVEFYWSAFLVEEVKATMPNGTTKATLRLDTIASVAYVYKDADILVFNSGHWFTPSKTNNGKNFYVLGNSVYGYLEDDRAYLRALMTWADWVDANVNPNRTRVFFRGYSNVHYSGGRWNSGGHCHKEVEPILNDAYLSPQPREMRPTELVIRRMRTPVTYLNITKLADYRKDAHPSIYTSSQVVPEKFQDCSHWCLPGVPDTWNELLYAMLIMNKQSWTDRED